MNRNVYDPSLYELPYALLQCWPPSNTNVKNFSHLVVTLTHTHTHVRARFTKIGIIFQRLLLHIISSSVILVSQIPVRNKSLSGKLGSSPVKCFLPSSVDMVQLEHKDDMVISEAKSYFFPFCDRYQTKYRQFIQISSFVQVQILITSKLPEKFTLRRLCNCDGHTCGLLGILRSIFLKNAIHLMQ
jgi:hypothetical protein